MSFLRKQESRRRSLIKSGELYKGTGCPTTNFGHDKPKRTGFSRIKYGTGSVKHGMTAFNTYFGVNDNAKGLCQRLYYFGE